MRIENRGHRKRPVSGLCRLALCLLLAGLLLGLTACGGPGDAAETPPPEETASTPEPTPEPEPAPEPDPGPAPDPGE